MARHASPTRLSQTKKRAAVAAGAIATTAALTVATPGTANAADSLPIDPGAILSDPSLLIGLAPALPGALPVLVAPTTGPQIADAVERWNGIPVVGSLFPANSSTAKLFPGIPIFGIPPLPAGLEFSDYPHAPSGWLALHNFQQVGVDAPFGLGGVSNRTYGAITLPVGTVLALLPALESGDLSSLADLDLGSVLGNKTDISGPFDSSLTTDMWLAAARENGVTTFTPGASIGGTAPFGLGNALFTFSPGGITYGDGVLILTGPSIGTEFGFLGTSGGFGLSTGSVGFDNGNLVFSGPDADGAFDSPFVNTDFSVDGGGGSAGTDGIDVTTPSGGGSVEGPLGTGGSANVNPGTVNVGTDGTASVDGPDGTVDVSGPLDTGATVTGDTGSGSVGPDGADVTGPSGSVDVTGPAGTGVGGNVDTGGANAGADGAGIDGPSGGATVDGPGGTGVSADASAGSAEVDSSGNVDTDSPSVDVDVDTGTA